MRKTIAILVTCTVLLLLGFVSYRGYQSWKQNHYIALAKQFQAREDVKNEALALGQALNANHRNLEANRMMADLLEATHSPSTLDWRRTVLELDPNSLTARLSLAQTALFFHDLATATNALAGVDDAGRNTASYHNISGELALMENKPDEAQADFAEAIRLDPSAMAPQLSLAVVQLHSSNALDMAEARINLKRISMNSTNLNACTQARRELTLDAIKSGDNSTALYYSKELVDQPGASFDDKLLRLDTLKITKSEAFKPELNSYEQEAAKSPDLLSGLSIWLVQRQLPGQALVWLQNLPAATQTNVPAIVLIAQCQMLTQNWAGLQNTVSKGNWGAIDYSRHAYMALALRQQGFTEASKAEWDIALTSANGQDAPLTALLRLAAQWKWRSEAEQILWTIVKKFPQEQWAPAQLTYALYTSGSTRALMELFNTLSKRNPADLDSQNNLAITAMLLNAQEIKPYDLARDIYQKDPTNPRYVCTYAFSLHLQGKDADALKMMQQLTPKDLSNDSTAGYYGLILKAAGNKTEANIYLKRSVQGQLLPEERTMFEQALAGL